MSLYDSEKRSEMQSAQAENDYRGIWAAQKNVQPHLRAFFASRRDKDYSSVLN